MEMKTMVLTNFVAKHQERRTLQTEAMQMQGEAKLHSCIDKQHKMGGTTGGQKGQKQAWYSVLKWLKRNLDSNQPISAPPTV
jgi:hypothetical protein